MRKFIHLTLNATLRFVALVLADCFPSGFPHPQVRWQRLALLSLPAFLPVLAAQTYKPVANYRLAMGSPAAIAIDTTSRRIYVAGSSGITVLNADTGDPAGTIAGVESASDVLVVPVVTNDNPGKSTTGFAATPSGVLMFDLGSAKVTSTAPIAGAVSVCYDPFTKTVATVGVDTLASVDASTGKVIGSAKVHAGSGQIACGTLGHVYVADPDANVVHVLNHTTLQNDGDYPMPAGSKPIGLTLDTKGRRLFVACEDGSVEIVDTDSGFTFIESHSGSGLAHGVFAWTPQGPGKWKAAAFFTHADGTLTGIRMMAFINYTLGGEWKIAPKMGSIAYDEKSHRLFVAPSDGNSSGILVLGY